MFSIGAAEIAPHKNLMPCVIFGRGNPVCVVNEQHKTEADIVCIKPGVLHRVEVRDGGAEIIYLDGVHLSASQADCASMNLAWRDIPDAFYASDRDAIGEFRKALDVNGVPSDPHVMRIVEELYSYPLNRLSQDELAVRLGLERTQALRHFKWTTGQTFRGFKRWAASVALVKSAHRGLAIGLAGIDAGFSDAAHTSRTVVEIFGLTPTAGLRTLRSVSDLELREAKL